MAIVIVFGILMVVLFAIWVAALVEVIRTPSGYPAGTQLVWVLVLLFGGPIGLILYGVLGRPGRRQHQPPSNWLR